MAGPREKNGHQQEETVPPIDNAPAAEILAALATARPEGRIEPDDLIPLLQRIQKRYGYLPREILTWVSEKSGIPTSRIYGVITFYAQFFLEPHGRHTICLCRGTACHVRGGQKVIETVSRALGIDEGGTTDDLMFSLETVACLGTCAIAPVMVIDGAYHGKSTPSSAERLLRQLAKKDLA